MNNVVTTYGRFDKALAVIAFVERGWVSSLAALVVGAFVVSDVWLDLRSVKLTAGVLGIVLPAAHLIAIWLSKRLARSVNSRIGIPTPGILRRSR